MDKEKILVVDDQPGVQLLLKKRLEAEGYDVIQAENGGEGLLKVVEHKPDLVLTDVVMPKMGGIEFFKRLRGIDGGEEVPVIVISKRALMKDCFDEKSIEGFFAKPFDMNALIEKIIEIFKEQDLLKELSGAGKRSDEDSDSSDRQNEQQGSKVFICKKCEKEMAKEVEQCPNCGCISFFTRAVYD